jgi:hypothetical protein
VFNPATGAWLGRLLDGSGKAISIRGLWSLLFGNGARGAISFTAGIAGGGRVGDHGLFGSLAPIAPSIFNVMEGRE